MGRTAAFRARIRDAIEQHRLLRVVIYWLPCAISITILSGFIYAAVQQDLRQSANDPQVQIAEDAAASLSTGEPAQLSASATKINIAQSLATFMIIYDNAGGVLASSAVFNGKTPAIPSGVFDQLRRQNEDWFTWQPAAGVRSAVVMVRYTGAQSGFVLAGRSIREIEKREASIRDLVLLGWAVAMLAAFAATAFLALVSDR